MVASQKQSTWLIVLSTLKLVVGAILLILCKFAFDALLALARSHSQVSAPGVEIWWIVGLPYMIPAIFGFLAGGTKTKGFIGLYMALNIIAMIVSGVFAIGSLIYLIQMTAIGGISCQEVVGQCFCRIGDHGTTILSDLGQSDGLFGGIKPVDVEDCGALNRLFGLLYGVTAMIISGWCLCLTASIVCCSACCCTSPSTRGVVYVQPEAMVTTVHTASYPVGPMPQAYQPVATAEAEEMTVKENFRYNRMP